MKHTVRKGLESPCTIRGMLVRDYWVFMALCAGAALLGVMGLRAGVVSGNWKLLGLAAAVSATGLPVLYFRFLKNARPAKFRTARRELTISNLDFFKKNTPIGTNT